MYRCEAGAPLVIRSFAFVAFYPFFFLQSSPLPSVILAVRVRCSCPSLRGSRLWTVDAALGGQMQGSYRAQL